MDENKVAKIRALLAKAEAQGATPEESETYRDKAYELMIKWQIDSALLGNKDPKNDPIQIREVWPTTLRTYSFEYANLIATIADASGSRGLLSKTARKSAKGGGYVRTAHTIAIVTGFASDLDAIEILVTSLGRQCEIAVAAAVTKMPRWEMMTPSEKYNFKRSFIIGFSTRIEMRIKAMRKQTFAGAGTGTEIAVYDRTKLVDKFVQDNIKTKETGAKRYGFDGTTAGVRAADKANIGQTDIGAKTTKEIGA